MSTPIEITPEIRQAVMDAECALVGHLLRFDSVSKFEGRNGRIEGPVPGQMPHIFCSRCDHVWIVISKDGKSYNAAERQFRKRLNQSDPEYLP